MNVPIYSLRINQWIIHMMIYFFFYPVIIYFFFFSLVLVSVCMEVSNERSSKLDHIHSCFWFYHKNLVYFLQLLDWILSRGSFASCFLFAFLLKFSNLQNSLKAMLLILSLSTTVCLVTFRMMPYVILSKLRFLKKNPKTKFQKFIMLFIRIL